MQLLIVIMMLGLQHMKLLIDNVYISIACYCMILAIVGVMDYWNRLHMDTSVSVNLINVMKRLNVI